MGKYAYFVRFGAVHQGFAAIASSLAIYSPHLSAFLAEGIRMFTMLMLGV